MAKSKPKLETRIKRWGERDEEAVSVSFTAYGSPQTNQRTGSNGKIRFTPTKTKVARQQIAQAFLAECGKDWTPHEHGVRLRVGAYHQQPKTNWWPFKPCLKKPDGDNVLKLVGDALNGIAWRDDQQIADMRFTRCWGKPRIEVHIDFIPEVTKPRHGAVKLCEGLYGVFWWGRWLGGLIKAKAGYIYLANGREPDPHEYEKVMSCPYLDGRSWKTLKQAEEELMKPPPEPFGGAIRMAVCDD